MGRLPVYIANAFHVARPARACKDDVLVNVVADRLHTLPPERCRTEQRRGGFGETLGSAVVTAEQEHQSVIRQFLDRVLTRSSRGSFRIARVADNPACPQVGAPSRGVAKSIRVAVNRDCRSPGVGNYHIGGAAMVNVQHQHHWGRLRTSFTNSRPRLISWLAFPEIWAGAGPLVYGLTSFFGPNVSHGYLQPEVLPTFRKYPKPTEIIY